LPVSLSHEDNLALGSFFLHGAVESDIESILRRFSLKPLGWRDVPTNDKALGSSALVTKPGIKHLLIDTEGVEIKKKELMLFFARKVIEKECGGAVYIPSMSSKTVVYKGLLVATNLDLFYPDLAREDFESAFCMFHQRFSTNTLPDWTLSQPMRVLAHNGEINTIQGNRNIMASYEHEARHEVFADAMDAYGLSSLRRRAIPRHSIR
jgi:glutamate synthase (NADPH/NADH) large chain